MKKIIQFILMAVVCASCTKQAFVYEDIESVVYFLNSGKVSLKPSSKSYEAVVIKGGNTNDETEVTVIIDESVGEEYNSENGTIYNLMPETAYSFTSGIQKVSNETKMVTYPIAIETAELEAGAWMIPIRLKSSTTKVNENKDKLLLVIEIK